MAGTIKRKGLGKGLDSLIPNTGVLSETNAPEQKPDIFVKLSRIEPNKDQPRKILMRTPSRNWRIQLSSLELFSL